MEWTRILKGRCFFLSRLEWEQVCRRYRSLIDSKSSIAKSNTKMKKGEEGDIVIQEYNLYNK